MTHPVPQHTASPWGAPGIPNSAYWRLPVGLLGGEARKEPKLLQAGELALRYRVRLKAPDAGCRGESSQDTCTIRDVGGAHTLGSLKPK